MRLRRGERSLLASFKSGPQAERALEALKQAGFKEAQMDRIGMYGYSPDAHRNLPVFGKESSLAHAVLGVTPGDDDSRPLMAAFPEVSGMSGGLTYDDMPFLVTVVTRQERIGEAVDIVEQHGGRA